MTPRHLRPLPVTDVHRLCSELLSQIPEADIGVRRELHAFRDSLTPHDARRLANALRHVVGRHDLADRVLALIDDEPRSGVLGDLKQGDRAP